jgi:hypothetical protein
MTTGHATGILNPSIRIFTVIIWRFPMTNRTLGTLAMVCAPALLVEVLLTGNDPSPLITGIAGMIFMLGSFCSLVGLWRAAATGTRWWGRTALGIQLALTVMAFLFGLFEATGLLDESSIIWTVTDLAWPLSMVFMLIVGITAAIARRLPAPQRFAPLLCGFAFPLSILAVMVLGMSMEDTTAGIIFFSMTTVFWGLLSLTVQQSEAVTQTVISSKPELA